MVTPISIYDYDLSALPAISEDLIYGNELIGRCTIDPTVTGTVVTDSSKEWTLNAYDTGYTLYVLTGSAAGSTSDISATAVTTLTITAITNFARGDWFAIVPDTAKVRYPIPISELNIGLSPDNKKESTGTLGAGRLPRRVKEGLKTVEATPSGSLICDNMFRNFDALLLGDYVNYMDGTLALSPSNTCIQAIQSDYAGGLAFVDQTVAYNTGGTITFFPAAETNNDRFMVGCADKFDAIRILMSAVVGSNDGDLSFWYSTSDGDFNASGADDGLTQFQAASFTDGTNNLQNTGVMSWKIPSNWVRATYTSNDPTGETTQSLYWVSLKVDSTYGTNPIGSQCYTNYPPHSVTLEESFGTVQFPRWRIITGLTPTKSTITLEEDDEVKVSYSCVAKNQIPSKIGFSTMPAPNRSYDYYQTFKTYESATITFTSSTITDFLIRNMEIEFEANRSGKGKVGRGETGISDVLSGSIMTNIKIAFSENTYSFEDLYEALAGTSAAQVDMTLELDDEVSLGSPSAIGADSAFTFTLSAANSRKLHSGDLVTIKEASNIISYTISSVDTSTGIVTLVQNLGKYDILTNADIVSPGFTAGTTTIYKRNYKKYTFTDVQFKSVDNRDLSPEGNEIVRTYMATPTAVSGDNIAIDYMPDDSP